MVPLASVSVALLLSVALFLIPVALLYAAPLAPVADVGVELLLQSVLLPAVLLKVVVLISVPLLILALPVSDAAVEDAVRVALLASVVDELMMLMIPVA